jgi:hypothetical protein
VVAVVVLADVFAVRQRLGDDLRPLDDLRDLGGVDIAGAVIRPGQVELAGRDVAVRLAEVRGGLVLGRAVVVERADREDERPAPAAVSGKPDRAVADVVTSQDVIPSAPRNEFWWGDSIVTWSSTPVLVSMTTPTDVDPAFEKSLAAAIVRARSMAWLALLPSR